MHILHLKNFPILHQLQIEEALLRLSDENFCLINEGSPPAIVMGISGKRSELVDETAHQCTPLPIIKRFSGGGTVVVDEQTLFISFICQKKTHNFPAYPEPIMRWTEELYKEAFQLDTFQLRENDYVLSDKKIGGNAQYLRKERWLHHTTFLWDYKKAHMDLLLHPKKTPTYRKMRGHEDFLTRLCEHLPSKEQFIKQFKESLASRFPLEAISLDDLSTYLEKPHRKNTQLITI